MSFPDAVGVVGFVLVLSSYFLVQAERLEARSVRYQSVNMISCIFIIYSLLFDFNLPAFLIQVCWFFVSLYGLSRNLLKTNG